MTALEYQRRQSSGPRAAVKRPGGLAMIVTLACVVYLVAFATSLFASDHRALFAPGLVLVLLGVFTFLYNGRQIIVATSVMSYAIVMFVGFPALYTSLGHYWTVRVESHSSLLIVVTLGFILQLATLVGGAPVPVGSRSSHPAHVSTEVSKGWLVLSVAMLVLAFGSRAAHVPSAPSAFGWLAVLFAAAVAFDIRAKRIHPLGILVLMIAVSGQIQITYGGFGRLNLAVLGMSVAIIAAVALRSWWVKTGILAVTAPALVYLANQRIGFLRDDLGRSPSDSEGIASVVGPLHSAAILVEALLDGRLELAFGFTAVVAALVWVPRAIWPAKPEGFGSEMVEVTRPSLASSEAYSDAATVVGEAVWNFGVWGAPLMLGGIIIAARLVDKALLRKTSGQTTPRDLVSIMIIVVLSASMLNMIWGGLFTATGRMFVALALLLLLRLLLPSRRKQAGHDGKSFSRNGLRDGRLPRWNWARPGKG